MHRLPKSARTALVSAALALAAWFGVICPAPVALADQFIPIGGGWKTCINDRFGMRLDYPADVFAPGPPPRNADGQAFASPDASLQIFATHNVLNETPISMKRDMVGMKDYENVTCSPSGNTWLVLSGYRDDTILCEKYFFTDGVISGFAIEFPAANKPFYAPIVERTENSFRAGHAD
jgi:hypothetical protein